MKRNITYVCLLVGFVLMSLQMQAQAPSLRYDFTQRFNQQYFNYNQARPLDYLESKTDTSSWSGHSPKKAALLAMVPGFGQIYNRKYWKVPLVWGGLGVMSYYVVENNKEYQRFREGYIAKYENIEADSAIHIDKFPLYTLEQLKDDKNLYWKKRDRMILFMAGFYIITIIDATVDAHLYSFDISDDLSMNVFPDIQLRNSFSPTETYGVRFRLNF
jgi:hypothetical protein